MSLFKKITGAVGEAVDFAKDPAGYFKPKESSWGNGLLADWMHTGHGGSGAPDGTGSFSEGMYDMSRQLGASRQGTNESWQGSAENRTYDSWDSGGLGWGGVKIGPWGKAQGQGIGGGFGEWHGSGTTQDGEQRQSHGYGFGAGYSETMKGSKTVPGLGWGAKWTGEQYKGIGGNAYGFEESGFTDMFGNDHGAASGYGVDGNYTGKGYNNIKGTVKAPGVNGNFSAENMVMGQYGGSLEGGTTEDGAYFGRGSYTHGLTQINDAQGSVDTKLGHTDARFGQFTQGPQFQGNGFYDPNTGNMSAGGQYTGGGFNLRDASVNHRFGNGMTANASVGMVDTNNSFGGNVGWNNETNNVHMNGRGDWGGVTVQNANLGFDAGNGWGANAHAGRVHTGNTFDGNATFGADGVHVNGNGQFGGFEAQNVGGSYGKQGVYYNQFNVGSGGTSTQVEGANLDINGNGVSAGVDKVRAGGFRANDITGRNDIGGVTTDYSLGELSNDVLVENANLDINGNGLHASVGKVDYGGIRVNDWKSHTDMGRAGSLDTSLGSFGTGDSIENAYLDINGDGVGFGAEKASLLGIDASNANVAWNGPGGAYANAHMGTLHTGLGVEGFQGSINGDGINLGARHADYNALQLKDLSANYNIPGVVESHASLGEGNYNRFSGDNLKLGLNENGLSASGDNLAYDYVNIDQLHANQSYGGGAVTTRLDLGHGSLGGGRADHLDYHSDGFNQSLSVDGLNAHGLQMSDVGLGTTVGDAGLNVGANTLNVLDLNVGHADAQTQMMGLAGQANVQNANLDLLNVQGGNAALTYGGTTVVGARGDYRSSAGVENASGDWDLTQGRAAGQFQNAHYGNQLSNASVNFLGNEIAIPDMGFDVNASGHGNVDLLAGQASGGINLAGSKANFAGYEIELGDWAQASGGVDLSQGAANFNVGGENGVGVNASLADMNLDLNLFGTNIDVDEGISDAAGWVASTAGAAGSWVASTAGDAWNAVTSFLPSISLW